MGGDRYRFLGNKQGEEDIQDESEGLIPDT